MARKTYTREFKLQAVRMLTDRGLSVAEVARQLGVSDNCLRNWRAAAQQRGESAFPGQGNFSPAEDELRRLRAEVHRLRAERDLLKKAAAYFASPPS
jgi:transposase